MPHSTAWLLLVDLGVEGGWPAALRPFPAPVRVLVSLVRDGGLDPPPTQIRPVGARRVRLIGQHPVRAGTRPAIAEAGHPDALQHRNELWAVPTLSRGEHDRQRLLALFTTQVQLGAQPTAGAAQRVIGRLVTVHPAGRLDLQIPLLRAPAACWCARATVESTLTSQTMRP